MGVCVTGARRRVHLQLLRMRETRSTGRVLAWIKKESWTRSMAGRGAGQGPCCPCPVRVTQPGQGPQKQSAARPRAPDLHSGVEPRALGCPGPWAAPGPAGSARAEGPGIARWPISLPSHPVPGGVTWMCKRPQSEAVSLDQAQL